MILFNRNVLDTTGRKKVKIADTNEGEWEYDNLSRKGKWKSRLSAILEDAMRFFITSLVSAGCLFMSTTRPKGAFGAPPGALAPHDSVLWSQLGNPGDNITKLFSATSGSGIGISGTLGGAGGTVDRVCPSANCNYGPAAPGFNAGDFLILTEDATGFPSGPLTFTFSKPVFGAGLFLQLNAPGTFLATLLVTGGTSGSENVSSNGNGDPLFIGALDATADITGIMVSLNACAPASPGGCSTADFAVDSLLLSSPVPEPAGFPLVALALACFAMWNPLRLLLKRMGLRKLGTVTLSCAAGLILATAPMKAQVADDVLPPGGALRGDGSMAARALPKAGVGAVSAPTVVAAPSLPTWSYQIKSPVDGQFYNGYMVGTSPFNRGARSTTIPVVLIPLIVVFHNTTSGFTTTFDPTSTPDAGCTGNQTAFSLIQNSPVFQNSPWTLNGVNVGNTQYVDAFRRANFWQTVQNTGNAYHTLLSTTVGATLTLPVNYTVANNDHKVSTVPAGTCTNPTASGDTNAAGFTGVVSINTIDAALNSYIATNGITANQFPLFIMYNVVMSLPNSPGFFDAGYHATQTPFPQSLLVPGQTYGIADLQTNQFFNNNGLNSGTSILSHEVSEWMDDPGVGNATPSWGHIGQVSGCQGNLETGDALTGTNLPGIAGPGGFTYFMQELVFYSWFFRTPATGSGGLFSDNGTFAADAGAVCH
jgi:hypothetical protein